MGDAENDESFGNDTERFGLSKEDYAILFGTNDEFERVLLENELERALLKSERMGLSRKDYAILFGTNDDFERALLGHFDNDDDDDVTFGAKSTYNDSDATVQDTTNPALEILVLDVLGLLDDVKQPSKKTVRNRAAAWNFIMSWTDDLF